MTTHKISVTVDACGIRRVNRVVQTHLMLDLSNISAFRLQELNNEGTIIDNNVSFDLDTSHTAKQSLTWLLTGETPATAKRHYKLCLYEHQTEPVSQLSLIQVSEIYHQGQASYHIQTPGADLIFHRFGGGFASLIDNDNYDWISYRPYGGSDGVYRGIPNIKHPDDYYHPGATNANSEILTVGTMHCSIRTWTLDGVCEAIWDIYPHYMTMTLLKAPDPYWLLYEGTPGGTLDEENGFIGRSDGTRTPLMESWDAVLDPGWLYFGASNVERVLFFAQHTTEPELSSYFPMEGNMTVFGFGRKDLEHYLKQVPATYSFGLVDSHEHDTIATRIESIRQDIEITVGDLSP